VRRLRLVSIQAVGLKDTSGFGYSDLALAPMTCFVGPNGSGKSALLGAVAYALQGHLPALKTGDVPALVSADRLHVTLNATSLDGSLRIRIDRGYVKKAYARALAEDKTTGKTREEDSGTGTKHLVATYFGPLVETYLGIADPERSVLTLTSEKRLKWAFAAAAPRIGWDKARVVKEIAPAPGAEPNPAWNPAAADDPVDLVAHHLKRAEERLTASKGALKDQETALGALAQPISEPSPKEIEEAARSREDKRKAYTEAAAAVAREKAKTERRPSVQARHDALAKTVDQACALRKALPLREATLRDLEEQAVGLSMELDDCSAQMARAAAGQDEAAAAKAALEGKSQCPLCQSVLPRLVLDELRALLDSKTRNYAAAHALAKTKHEVAEADLEGLATKRAAVAKDIAAAQGMILELPGRRAELEALAAELANCCAADETVLAHAEAEAKARSEAADALFQDLSARQALVKERTRQKDRLETSKKAVELAKAWLERLRDVRARMLRDAASAFQQTLDKSGASTLGVGRGWRFDVGDEGMDIGYLRDVPGGSIVPGTSLVRYAALSAGERVLAHVVLGASVPYLGNGDPWSCLLVDDVEVLEPRWRKVLFRYLHDLAQAGHVSNVFVGSSDERDAGLLADLGADSESRPRGWFGESLRVYDDFLKRER
jgi:hypothetical protein